jgi:hypothetical protein
MAAIEQIAELNNWATICIETNRMGEALGSLQSALQLSKSQLVRFQHQQQEAVKASKNPPMGLSGSSSFATRIKDTSISLPPAGTGTGASTPHPILQPTSAAAAAAASSSSPIRHQHEEATRMALEFEMANTDEMMMDDTEDDDSFPSTDPFKKSFAAQYREPIHIDSDSLPASLDCATHSGLTSIIVFNLALLYDLAASETDQGSPPRFQAIKQRKAKTLYEQVVQLYVLSCMNEEGSNGCCDTSRIARKRPGMLGAIQDLVAMAAVNNLFHLEQEDEGRKEVYIQMLVEIAKLVGRADYGDTGELRRLVNWQGGIFLSNAFFLKTLLTGHGAAAA